MESHLNSYQTVLEKIEEVNSLMVNDLLLLSVLQIFPSFFFSASLLKSQCERFQCLCKVCVVGCTVFCPHLYIRSWLVLSAGLRYQQPFHITGTELIKSVVLLIVNVCKTCLYYVKK